jgi:ABC-type sugar transport system permease subunit
MAVALSKNRLPQMSTTGRFPALWILPVLVPVAAFTIFPVAHALWTSLHQVMLLFPDQDWVGLDNYRNVITGEYFGVALKNSLLFTLFSAPLVVVAGTATALFLQRDFYGVTALRSVVLLPWVLPGAISAVLWTWIFHPSWGVINSLLRKLDLIDRSIPWLNDPNLALVSVVIAHVWTQIPFTVVLVMAALSTLSKDLIEAAELDGATSFQRFAHVVFPHIKAILVVLLIYNALTAFTTYDIVYAMTGGGPGTATTLLSFQIWKESFSMYDFGAGSAVAFIVVIVSAILIVAITKAMPSDLFEDA